jgi:hypothetical protein
MTLPTGWKRWAIVGGASAIALVVAFLAGQYSAPKPEIRWKEVASVRTEWLTKEVEHRVEGPIRIRTVVREIPGPQGPERVVERVVERGPVTIDRSAEGQGSSAANLTTELVQKPTALPGWRVGVSAGWDRFQPSPNLYGLELDRRLFGTLWVGIRARTDKSVGAALSLEW